MAVAYLSDTLTREPYTTLLDSTGLSMARRTMANMMTCLSRNLGYRKAGAAWLRQTLNEETRPDLVFIQEVLPSLITSPPAGYNIITGPTTPKAAEGRTSAMLFRDGEGEVDRTSLPSGGQPFAALGTYVAAARIHRGAASTWLASVHTSPSIVTESKRRPDFNIRSCEAQPWWSDAFLSDARTFTAETQGRAVVVGDFNQSRAYDTAIGHTCGGEFLDAMESMGFVDLTSRDWGNPERPTRHNPDYLLDRVFVSADIASGSAVDTADLIHDNASDHAAVWFVIPM